MKFFSILFFLFFIFSCSPDRSGDQQKLIGNWQLISWSSTNLAGENFYPFGEKAQGNLIYDEEGRMNLTLINEYRVGFKDIKRRMEAEKSRAYDEFFSYYGDYEINGNEVTHFVKGASYPYWTGTTQKRTWAFEGDELILNSEPKVSTLYPGDTLIHQLRWKRN